MSEDKKTCFVVCPIGAEDSETRKRTDTVYKHILEPVLTQKEYELRRADKIFQADTITETILKELETADLVIADITETNPNVYYELGYRTALKKPVIQIARKDTSLPFDISTKRTFFYDENNLDYTENFKIILLTIIDNIEEIEKNKPETSNNQDMGEIFAQKLFDAMLESPENAEKYMNIFGRFFNVQ